MLILVSLTTTSHAGPIAVGDMSIKVPTPTGFARVVPEMTAVSSILGSVDHPTTMPLALYIPEESVPQALAKEIPVFSRYLKLSTAKELSTKRLSLEAFDEIKRFFKGELENQYAAAKEQLPAMVQGVTDAIEQKQGVRLQASIDGVVTLTPHHEDRHTLSHSMIGSVEFVNEEGVRRRTVHATTATCVYVNGRVLFVDVIGSEDDLEWTREFSKVWVKAIIEANANPDVVDIKTQQRSPIDHSGEWMKIIAKVIGGAILVGLLWLASR